MLQVTSKEMKTNEKKLLQSGQGIHFWLPDQYPISFHVKYALYIFKDILFATTNIDVKRLFYAQRGYLL